MSELLLQIGATKLALSLVLAGTAWTVQRRVGRPGVSYHIWLLVLVVLLVPTVVSLPVLPAEPAGTVVTPASGSADVVLAEATSGPSRRLGPGALAGPALAIMWLLGTIGLLGWSMVRTTRFRRVLAKASTRASAQIQHEAAAMGRKLGLARIPEVRATDARVTPLVWWTGGKVRVLISAWILDDLTRDELRAILAHELAHVRRRDHLVRWLEWLACSAFWWNPVAWWAPPPAPHRRRVMLRPVGAGSGGLLSQNLRQRAAAGGRKGIAVARVPSAPSRHRGRWRRSHRNPRKEAQNDRFNRHPLPRTPLAARRHLGGSPVRPPLRARLLRPADHADGG